MFIFLRLNIIKTKPYLPQESATCCQAVPEKDFVKTLWLACGKTHVASHPLWTLVLATNQCLPTRCVDDKLLLPGDIYELEIHPIHTPPIPT